MTGITIKANNVITINTLTDSKLYGVYNSESTTVAQFIDSFFNNYSCKEYEENKLQLYSAQLEQYLEKSNILIKDMKFEFPIVLKVKVVQNNTEIETAVLSDDQLDYYNNLMKKINDSKKVNYKSVMDVFVKSITGKTYTFAVLAQNFLVQDFKLLITHKLGIPVDQQRLIFQGRQLEDGKTFSQYQISPESTLNLVLRLRGGMFHETSGRLGNFEPLKSCIFHVNETENVLFHEDSDDDNYESEEHSVYHNYESEEDSDDDNNYESEEDSDDDNNNNNNNNNK